MKDEEIPKDNIEEAVFSALKKAPGFELPPGFADRVVGMVSRKVTEKEAQRDRWWLIIGILSILVTFIYAFIAAGFKPEVGVFTFFSGYSGLVVFGVIFVAALHLVDKILLKKNPGSR